MGPLSPSSVYRTLNRHGLLWPRTSKKPPQTKRSWVRFERAKPHELWQVDVSYWYIQGWGYYYLHTVLDDHSGYVITSYLYRTYGAADGIRMLEKTLAAVPAADRPHVQLLADHGVTYTAESFRTACQTAKIDLIFASVAHPQTKGYDKLNIMESGHGKGTWEPFLWQDSCHNVREIEHKVANFSRLFERD